MLVLRRKNEEATFCRLDALRITVGRDESNDVVLDDASVSGFHAVLFCEDSRYIAADLGSTNGSFVNGQRISGRAEFTEGDQLSFGTVSLDAGDSVPRRRATVVMPTIQIEITGSSWSTATLRLISGNGQPTVVTLGASLSVGRSADNDLVLNSDMVSAHHASIILGDGNAEILDHGSTNGTYVNDGQVSHRQLRHGDRIRFDTIEYLLEMPDSDLRATRVNPAVPSAMVLAKQDELNRELTTSEFSTPIPVEKLSPPTAASSLPLPSVPNAPAVKTVIQPSVSHPRSDADTEEPVFLRDDEPKQHRFRADSTRKPEEYMPPAPGQSEDDGIDALFRLAFSNYIEWLPAIALIACGIALQTWFSYKAMASRAVLDNVLAMTSSLGPFAGFSVLVATSAKKLGYGIDSAFSYGLLRFLPLLGSGMVVMLVLIAPILVFAVIGFVGANLAGSQAAGMLLMIPGYLVSIYLLLRLWPMMVMAITDRDALALRPAWRLTGQPGAFMTATGPILVWWVLPMLVTLPMSIFGGIPGYVIASIISVLFLMPILGLLVVSRYMRLHALTQASVILG